MYFKRRMKTIENSDLLPELFLTPAITCGYPLLHVEEAGSSHGFDIHLSKLNLSKWTYRVCLVKFCAVMKVLIGVTQTSSIY